MPWTRRVTAALLSCPTSSRGTVSTTEADPGCWGRRKLRVAAPPPLWSLTMGVNGGTGRRRPSDLGEDVGPRAEGQGDGPQTGDHEEVGSL